MATHIENFWNGRFLEWTWDLLWNKCLQNIPIRKYLNEKILDVNIGSIEENLENKKIILECLNENNYYYVNDEIKLITNNNVYICRNQYLYNKFL